MVKSFKFFVLTLLITLISCSSDDSDIDPSLRIDSYVEPYLNFLVTEETFIADNGPAQESVPFSGGFLLSYNRDLDGIIEYSYIFLPGTNLPGNRYVQLSVCAEPNQHNLNLLKNTLTANYGEPEFFQGLSSTTDTYIFPSTETYNPSISYTRNFDSEVPFLFVNYTFNGN